MPGLRFILGRAGSGKTHLCRTEILRELESSPHGPSLIFLVPEQSTFQMERALAVAPGLGGFLRAQVLSFRRLAARVLAETGGSARPRLTEVGRLMALRALVCRHQAELKVFGRVARRRGFVEQLAGTLAELRAYGIDLAVLERTRRRLQTAGGPPGLLAKLHDLELVARVYERYLEGCFVDPDDVLTLCARAVPACPLLEDAEVWVDGFAGFTPQEYRVLEALLGRTRRINVSLCLDPVGAGAPPRDTDLFYPTQDTFHRLRSRALALGIPIEPATCLPTHGGPPRFVRCPDLAFLEGNFERIGAKCPADPPTAVRLFEAADRREEVEAAARQVVRLARDAGYRWREIVVLLRETEPYRDLLGPAFEAHEVPFFLDERRSGLYHPLVELCRAAVQVIASRWSQEAVLRYLKTDLLPVNRDEADRLENHALAWGIRGAAWTGGDPWPGGLEEARRRATSALAELAQLGATGPTAGEWARRLRRLLEVLEVEQRLGQWREQALAAGRPEEAQEHDRVWTGVTGLLEEIASALGDEVLEAAALADVLETGLATLRLGLVPPSLDQVIIGQVDRSRIPDVRAALVLGVAEGTFPRPPREDPVFDDTEREILLRQGMELAPTSRERLLREGYLGYIALTRPSEFLWVSYPRAGEDGKAIFPSTLVRRLCELFPALRPWREPPAAFLATEASALRRLAVELRRGREGVEVDPFWRELHGWFTSRPEGVAKLRAALAGLDHRNRYDPLPRELVRRLYGEPLRASVSRLERFAACPYAHFLEYGLGLRERMRYRLEPEDVGTFLHDGLKVFVQEMKARGLDWGPEHADARERLAQEVLTGLVPGVQRAILLSSSRYRFLAATLERSFRHVLRMLASHARRSGFEPLAVEIGFGPGQPLPPLSLEVGEGSRLQLRGRIDRVDVARQGDVSYLRVVDYKSSRQRLDPGAVAAGVDLQLLAYLAVVMEHASRLWPELGRLAPAGAFYLPLLHGPVRCEHPLPEEEVQRHRLEQFRMDGLAVAEPEVVRLLDAGEGSSPPGHLVRVRLRKDGLPAARASAVSAGVLQGVLGKLRSKLAELGAELANGEVAARPYRQGGRRACRFCEFRPVCGHDPLVGDSFRDLPHLAGLTWEQLAEEEAP